MKSAPTEAAPSRRRKWRRRRRIAGILLLLLVVGGVWPGFWLPSAIEVVAPWAARRFAGLELSIEEVERANWSTLELRGLLLRAEGEEPWIDVRAPRVAADFTLRAVASEPLRSVSRVELTRPRVALAFGGGEATASESSGGGVRLPSWPDQLPEFHVLDGEFRMSGVSPRPLVVTGLEVTTGEGERLELDFARLQLGGWLHPDEFQAGELRARYASGAWTGVQLVADGQTLLRDSRADLSNWDSGRYVFDAHVDFRGANGDVSAELTRERMSGRVALEQVPFAWIDPYLPEGSGLTGLGRLNGTWAFPTANPLEGAGEAELEFTDVSLHSAPPAHLTGAISWKEGALTSDNLRVDQALNHLQVVDFTWQLDSVELSAFEFRLSAEVRDMRSLAAFAGAQLPDEPVPDHDLQLLARVSEGRLLIERGFLDTAGGRLTIEEGVITQTPTPDTPRRVELTADFDQLAELGRLFSAGAWNGSLAGDLVYSDDGGGPELRCALIGEDVTVEGHELGNVRLDGRVDPPLLTVSEAVSDGPAGLVRGAGVFDWETQRLSGVNLELELRDLSRLAPQAGIRGTATGALSLDGPIDQLDGSVSLESTGLTLDGFEFTEGNVQADFSGGDLRVQSLHLADHAAQLDLAGDLALDSGRVPQTVALERFRVSVSDSNLELAEPTSFSWDGETARLERTRLAGSAGSLDVTVDWGPARRQVELLAQDLRLDVLLRGRAVRDFALDGLDGELRLAIEDEVAVGNCDLSVRGFAWPGLGPPLDLVLRADQRDRVLTVGELLVSGTEGELLRGRARLPLAPLAEDLLPDAPIDVELTSERGLARQLGLALGHPQTAGELMLNVDLGGTLSRPTGRLDALVDDLSWAPAPDRPAIGPARLDLALVLEETGVRIERGGGTLDSAEAVDLRGRVIGPTDLRRWLDSPAFARDETSLDVHFVTDDFDWQRVAVQLDRIGLPSGPVRTGVVGAELDITGPLSAPELSGSARLRDGSARMGNLPSITEVESNMRFEGRVLTLEGFTGELGGAPFKLSGTLGLEGDDLMIDARLVGNDLLVVRQGGTRVRANVDATATGPLRELVIGGRAEVAEGVYSTPIDVTAFLGGPKPARARGIQLFRVSEPPLADAKFDLEIGTAPNSSFMISTSTYKGGIRPDLHLGGTGALPILTGTLYFDPAVVSLPVTRLRVTSGTLVFDEANPFVPTLQIQAEGRMRGYDVFAQVGGPFDATEVTLSSDPPLNATELLNLVLTGRVPGDETTRAGDVAQQLATYLAKDFLSWWIAPEPGDKSSDSLMDRIEIITGEDVSKTGANTMEGRFRVADDVTRKDDAIYLIGQRDEYDFYNFGIRISFRVK
ncbi:MAG: translocation/assembly module TamB domain-containing protein [Planctomycetes bacterium]|nr:translocation/assembly module TamB domain-containing protein [Planctomycetota bacterium]